MKTMMPIFFLLLFGILTTQAQVPEHYGMTGDSAKFTQLTVVGNFEDASNVLYADSTHLTIGRVTYIMDGILSAPSFLFSGNNTVGFYSGGNGYFNFVSHGVKTLSIFSDGGNLGLAVGPSGNPFNLFDVNGKFSVDVTNGLVTCTNKITGLTQATGTTDAVAGGRTITAGAGLSGGGNLTADRTITLAATDTVSKGFEYAALATTDSDFVFAVNQSNMTLRGIKAIRIGGTSCSINATRTRSGTTVDLLTANYSVTTSYASAGTLQNTDTLIDDMIKVTVRAVSGTIDKLFIQFTWSKPQL